MNYSFIKKLSLLIIPFIWITATIGFAQNKAILQGQIKQSDGSPAHNSAVLLIEYNPVSKTYSVIDSANTHADGKYIFEAPQYFIFAIPDKSSGNELPTYYGNTLFSEKATPISMNYGEAVVADFVSTRKVSMNEGSAAIGGVISLGKNISAASKLTVFLADKDKNPVAMTSTDLSGIFNFKNIAYGDYCVWIDLVGVDNTAADVINVNALNPLKDNLHFQIGNGNMNWIENNYSNIKDALANKESVYSLRLNSLQQDAADKSLTVASADFNILNAEIGEFANLETLTIDINRINFLPGEIGKLTKLMRFSANLNKLSLLPFEMENLTNMRLLDLGKNNFSTFPGTVTKYPLLEILNFENNPVTVLPPTINALKNLKDLNLANCVELLKLPPEIGELTNLETLNLSNCIKLKSLPKEIVNLKNLKVLDITGTKISPKKFQKAVPGCDVRMTVK